MIKKKSRNLSTILGIYVVVSIISLSGVILYWTYYSASKAINIELKKSFNQRYSIVENIIERETERIGSVIQKIKFNNQLLSEISNNQFSQAQKVLEKILNRSEQHRLDVLFISKTNAPVWLDVSSPVPNIQPILEKVAAESRKFLTKAKIVRFKNNTIDLTGIFKSKKMVADDGEVLGIVVAGTILNDNILLLNKIRQKTKSPIILLIDHLSIIASSISKERAMFKDIATHLGQCDFHCETGFHKVADSLISRPYKINLNGTTSSAGIIFSMENDVQAKLKKVYLNTLVIIIIVFIIFLFLTLLVIRRLIYPSIERMLDYTEKISQGNHHISLEPGAITELNTIGFAMEKMIGSINKAQSKLQASEERFRELADSLPQVVFEVDETGNIIYTNQNAFDLFKYTKDQLDKGLNIAQMIAPEHRDRAMKNIKNVLNGNQARSGEYTAQRHDGTTFPVMIHANIMTQNEKSIGLRGLLIDISNQKQMEADLQRRALAIDHSSETIVITDTKGSITYVNPAFEKITGYSRKEAMGKNPCILKSGNQNKSFYKELWEIISNGKTWSGRFINKKKNGSYYTEDATISPVFSGKGEIINYVAVKRDITEKLNLESQLQQARKMETIGTLAGGIAHDFNNILFPIIGHTELLLHDISQDSPLRSSLNGIYAGALRAKGLVEQILTFSRQGSNRLTLMKMQPIVKEALKLIRSSIPTTIDIKLDINPACGVIKADPTQIHQIVMNLTTNAYHAMEDIGGELKVSLKETRIGDHDIIIPDMSSGLYVCLTVADTGVGMDKNLTQKIFDPFFTTKEKGKGTGMGLSVVHGIVKSMDGAIQVYSEPGKGTEFHIYFPIEMSSFRQQDIQTKKLIAGGIERILIVDDEDDVVTMERQLLEHLGYQVTSRTSSIEALEAFRENSDKFDMVITDMTMPNMSGDKLSAELLKIRSDIPVLLCTGFSETMSEKNAASMGIRGFLLKPVVMEDLARKIREVLDENKK
jgi:PAS domain S-box-containing protein